MHELTITRGILNIVLQKACEVEAERITRIDLRLGELTGCVAECIQLQFAILSKHTRAAGAVLSFQQSEARLHCRKCDIDYSPKPPDLTCPRCRGLEIDVLSGLELSVDSIEVQ